jgi:hypothetical protein
LLWTASRLIGPVVIVGSFEEKAIRELFIIVEQFVGSSSWLRLDVGLSMCSTHALEYGYISLCHRQQP